MGIDSTWVYQDGDTLGYPFTNYLRPNSDLRAEDHAWMGGAAGIHVNATLDVKLFSPDFSIYGGGYSTTSEPAYGDNTVGANFLVSFIEESAAALTDANWYYRFQKTVLTNFLQPQNESQRIPQNQYYSTGYHSYA